MRNTPLPSPRSVVGDHNAHSSRRESEHMEIRNRTDRRDLRAALAARDRAWRVGYRGFVDQAVIDAAVADPDEDALRALEEELESEPGKFLVAVAPEENDGSDDVREGSDGADADESTGDGDRGQGDEGPDVEESDAESDPDVLGYVRVRWGATSPFAGAMEAEIVDLYVDPAHWREGVGTALVDAVTEWTPGVVDGIALSVLETNERARAFLEASGFERDGAAVTEIGGREHDAVVYRRTIERP